MLGTPGLGEGTFAAYHCKCRLDKGVLSARSICRNANDLPLKENCGMAIFGLRKLLLLRPGPGPVRSWYRHRSHHPMVSCLEGITEVQRYFPRRHQMTRSEGVFEWSGYQCIAYAVRA